MLLTTIFNQTVFNYLCIFFLPFRTCDKNDRPETGNDNFLYKSFVFDL